MTAPTTGTALDTGEAGPECETCGKTTCPDADLPAFSEPKQCEYAPVPPILLSETLPPAPPAVC